MLKFLGSVPVCSELSRNAKILRGEETQTGLKVCRASPVVWLQEREKG